VLTFTVIALFPALAVWQSVRAEDAEEMVDEVPTINRVFDNLASSTAGMAGMP